MAEPALVLASRSPQRHAILDQLGVRHEVRAADVEEEEGGDPAEAARENAVRKARAVAAQVDAAKTVIGCDTLVTLEGRIYGKPADVGAARASLQALSGRDHLVLSGLCVIDRGEERTALACTRVRFRRLTPALLDWYLATGEWRERAGGYAVQGRGAALVDHVEGDYSNVVGLPVAALLDLLPGLLGDDTQGAV